MVETAEVGKRVRRTIEQSKRIAQERRGRAAAVEREGGSVLASVVTPVFKTVAATLKSEGYQFQVFSPVGAVRLAADASGQDFIELALDTMRDPPALIGRVSREWGRRVLVDEKIVLEDSAIASLTEEDALAFVLGELPPFVER